MRSIATTGGDAGQTSLAGGVRVSKSSLRVNAYGSIDELNAALGLARALCDDSAVRELTQSIQRELFTIGAALATPPNGPKPAMTIEKALIDRLTSEVHRLEAIDGLLSDWSVAGEHVGGAAFNVARTVCRRAERDVVQLADSGEEVQPSILAYLNRLSDLLWLLACKLEHDAGINSSLRAQTGKSGNPWSRAW
jgi:cob(I)alamin adenosyltransferase